MNLIERIKSDINEINSRLEVINREREVLLLRKEYAESLLQFGGDNGAVGVKLAGRTIVGPLTHASAARAVHAVLEDSPTPMRLSDIAGRAIELGYGGGEADMDKVVPNFSSMLSKSIDDPNFPIFKITRGIFGLKDKHSNFRLVDPSEVEHSDDP